MPVDVTNTITFGRTPLPNTTWNGDISQLLDLLVAHLTGSLDDGALVGQIGGTEPLTNIGLWLNNNTWYAWSTPDGQYLPFPIVTGSLVGGILYTTQLISGADGSDVTLFLPNKDGATLATVEDVATPTVTKTASGTAISIDWGDIGNNGILYANLTGNATLTEDVSNSSPLDGQRIDIFFEQSLAASGALTVTWPTTWVVQVASSVLQTRGSATTRYIDHFIVRHVGTTTFVEQGKTFQISTTTGPGSDVTPPVVTDITVPVGSNIISVEWNESLQGVTLNTAGWSVKKNSVTNTVSSATASGNTVTLRVANTYGSHATGTVAYSGTDVKDLAGNLAATFTAMAITIDTGGEGGNGNSLEP